MKEHRTPQEQREDVALALRTFRYDVFMALVDLLHIEPFLRWLETRRRDADMRRPPWARRKRCAYCGADLRGDTNAWCQDRVLYCDQACLRQEGSRWRARLSAVLYLRTPRTFECFFHFLGWHCWSLGVHVDPTGPMVDVHVPLGFFRLGWLVHAVKTRPRTFGWR